MPALAVGDHVVAQHPVRKHWTTTGIVVEIGPNRDYLVKSSAGRVCRRNRRMLRRRVPVMPGNLSSSEPIIAAQPEQLHQPPARRSTREKKTDAEVPSRKVAAKPCSELSVFNNKMSNVKKKTEKNM